MKYLLLLLLFCGCHSQGEKSLKVAATPVPHAEMLEAIAGDLEEKGVHLQIVEIDDYNLPNRLLAEGSVDANFFQHIPFLECQVKECGYPLVAIKKIHIEPLGIYSKRFVDLSQLPPKAKIAIPCDPTNEARALELLAHLGLIAFHCNVLATPLEITDNPHKIHFEEVDAALLPRILPDVDFAIIPANYALQIGLNPSKDALALEPSTSAYANVLVVREGEENRSEILLLAELLTSEKMQDFLEKRYKGAILSIR